MDFSFLNAERAVSVAINDCISSSCSYISSSFSRRHSLPSHQAEPWEAEEGRAYCLVTLPWMPRMQASCQFFVFSPVDILGIFYALQVPGRQHGKGKPVFSGPPESCFKAWGY